jgi:hypothetical protein
MERAKVSGQILSSFYSVVDKTSIRHISLYLQEIKWILTLWTGINNASWSVLGWSVLFVTYRRLARGARRRAGFPIQTGVVSLRSCCLDIARDEVVPHVDEPPLLPCGRWNGLFHFPPILLVPDGRSRPNILEWISRSVLWVGNCNHIRIYCTIRLVIDDNWLEVIWKGAVMSNWRYYSGIHIEGQRRVMKQPGQSVLGPRVRPGAFLVFSFRGLCVFPYFIPFVGGPTET